jgi:solute carrier family 25 phosphate transporter 3
LIGYSLQGLGKFGFYELFKDVFKGAVGDENAVKYRKLGWCISSACAEVIADCLLCPFEATKVRVQTSRPGTYPTNFFVAFNKLRAEEGFIEDFFIFQDKSPYIPTSSPILP